MKTKTKFIDGVDGFQEPILFSTKIISIPSRIAPHKIEGFFYRDGVLFFFMEKKHKFYRHRELQKICGHPSKTGARCGTCDIFDRLLQTNFLSFC